MRFLKILILGEAEIRNFLKQWSIVATMTFHVSSIVAKALTFPLGKPDSDAVVGLHRTLYGHPKPGEA